jgi:MFS superfamily sulfate permease-like transporter
MHNGPRTKYDQELFAQGVGNTLCGFLGALPMTGVIVRSSANVLAGGKTRLSAILHGVWLLVFVTGMATLLRQIPTSCLAAILVYTGYKLIDVKSLRELRGYGWGEVVIYAITVSVIVFEDLLMGVLVGLGLSALKLIYTVSHLQIIVEPVEGEKRMRMRLNGSATFIRLPMLASRLEKIPPGFELYVDLTDLDYIDHACLDLLHSWGTQQRLQGGELVIDWESLHARFRRDRFAKTPDVGQLPS